MSQENLKIEDFVTREQLAESLGIKPDQITRWMRERKLPAIRLGVRVYFHVPAVLGWMKTLEAATEPSPEAGEECRP
jgi:excisionase family DNA binding protein